MRKKLLYLAVGLVLAGAIFWLSQPADAATISFPFPLNNVDQLPVGSTLDLGTIAVPADAQGRVCTVSVFNGQSIHTGASITFTSGASSVTLNNVEETSNKLTTGTMTVNTTIHAAASIGKDPDHDYGGFSLGDALFVCDTPVTTTAPPTTTTPRPTPVPPTPVAVPPGFTG